MKTLLRIVIAILAALLIFAMGSRFGVHTLRKQQRVSSQAIHAPPSMGMWRSNPTAIVIRSVRVSDNEPLYALRLQRGAEVFVIPRADREAWQCVGLAAETNRAFCLITEYKGRIGNEGGWGSDPVRLVLITLPFSDVPLSQTKVENLIVMKELTTESGRSWIGAIDR